MPNFLSLTKPYYHKIHEVFTAPLNTACQKPIPLPFFLLVPIFLTYHFCLHPIILPLFLANSQFFHNTINLFRSSDVSPMQVRCKSHLSPIFLQAKYRRYLQDVYDLQTNRRAPLARCPPYILYNVSLNLPHQFNFLTAVFPAKAGE